jgi:hypothetical protein
MNTDALIAALTAAASDLDEQIRSSLAYLPMRIEEEIARAGRLPRDVSEMNAWEWARHQGERWWQVWLYATALVRWVVPLRSEQPALWLAAGAYLQTVAERAHNSRQQWNHHALWMRGPVPATFTPSTFWRLPGHRPSPPTSPSSPSVAAG